MGYAILPMAAFVLAMQGAGVRGRWGREL